VNAAPSTSSPDDTLVGAGEGGRSRWRALLRVAVRFGLAAVVLGAVVGFLWSLLAPVPTFVATAQGLLYTDNLPGEYVAADGWFAVLGAAAGVLVAVVVLVRRGVSGVGIGTVVAVAALGVLGSLVAWRAGHSFSPADPGADGDGRAAIGATVHGALDLSAHGVLLVWPVASLVVLTFALVWEASGRPDDRAGAETPADSVGGDGDLGDLDGRQ